jgi:hypothetical protein
MDQLDTTILTFFEKMKSPNLDMKVKLNSKAHFCKIRFWFFEPFRTGLALKFAKKCYLLQTYFQQICKGT